MNNLVHAEVQINDPIIFNYIFKTLGSSVVNYVKGEDINLIINYDLNKLDKLFKFISNEHIGEKLIVNYKLEHDDYNKFYLVEYLEGEVILLDHGYNILFIGLEGYQSYSPNEIKEMILNEFIKKDLEKPMLPENKIIDMINGDYMVKDNEKSIDYIDFEIDALKLKVKIENNVANIRKYKKEIQYIELE